MGVKGQVIRWYMKSRVAKLQSAIASADDHQQTILQELISAGKETAFGKEHSFESIHNYQDFCAAVPIRDYEALKPWLNRAVAGEAKVVWNKDIRWFAKSSGTTSDKSKYIPVSAATLKTAHYQGAFDVMSMYCHHRPNTQIFEGKTLIVSGSQQQHQTGSRIRSGDISAIMVYNQPFLADFLRTPPKSVSLMEDFEKKLDLAAASSIMERVSGLAGVPTWNIVLLQKVLAITGKQNISEIWPGLELYLHGGVNFEPYRSTFDQLIPDKKLWYLQTYNASEGFFAYQDRPFADDMLLATHHGIFYEFIPQGQYHLENPDIVPLHEVEAGKQYAMVISTNSGLWRYKIGDTVQFSSVRPYRLRVTGRTKSFINAFGEEVIIENTDQAIAEACRRCNAIIKDYTVAPRYLQAGAQGAHEWLIEFEQMPEDMQQFRQLLDRHLRALNSDYDAKRSGDLALMLPIIHVAEQGLFYQWLKDHQRIGAQNKVPRLSNDRKVLEALLKLQSR